MSLKLMIPVMVLALGLSAHARPGKGEGKGGGPGRIIQELDLSSEQKDQVKTLWKNQRESMKAFREQRKAAKEKLSAAFKSGASDDALKTAHQELQTTQNKAGTARFENMLAIRKVLTPEQRTKFDKMRDERMEKAMRRMGRGKMGSMMDMDDGEGED